jgi:glycosyltransferase involved in cell wall biosynthesis
MRIAYIAAGAGGSYCGACSRDVTLARGLTARGHDVLLLPLYTPLRADLTHPAMGRIFYGGINAYLQQRSALFRHAPRFVDWLFDRPWLLKLVSRYAIETQPEGLGEMTVSVLRGTEGMQRKELERLVGFLEREHRPDVVNLTNSLLSAVAPEVKRRLGVPLFCTLQGEEAFVARLPQPHRDEAVSLMRGHAQHFDRLFSPGEGYADEMSEFLGVPRERVHVVRPGIELGPYQTTGARVREPFRIGFLSRVTPAKGLDILVEAFILLEGQRPGRATLSVAGEVAGTHRGFLRRLRRRLALEGLADRFEYLGEVDLATKAAFLKSLSAFCLPSRYAERRAMACLEAMAAGLPVVVPALGLFPELIALTGGGVAVPAEHPSAVAAALAGLMDEPDGADRMGRAAAEGVARHFSAETMAEQTLTVYERVLAAGTGA